MPRFKACAFRGSRTMPTSRFGMLRICSRAKAWCALGMRLGFEPESWSTAWGILSYLATLGLLCRFTYIRTGRSAFIALPVAAMAGALHHDWSIFASSGLETSAFTFLAVAGYYL